MEQILEIYTRSRDPREGNFKVKKGLIVNYNYGMKKAKVVIHPVSLEGIITETELNGNGIEITTYEIKISYGSEDVFDLNRYMEYMSKNDIIKNCSKSLCVKKKELKKVVFSDLKYVKPNKIEDYFIEELGVSPNVYKKKKKVSKRVLTESKYVKKEFFDIGLDEIALNATGLTFDEIKKLNETAKKKLLFQIAEYVSSFYKQIYLDDMGAEVMKEVTYKALNRALIDTYSNRLSDYIIKNEISNEYTNKIKNKLELIMI